MPQKVYKFSEQNALGQNGEGEIRAHFAAMGIETFSVPLATNKLGIDFWAIQSGVKIYFEAKTDSMTARTQNVFIETVSNSSTGKLGWLFSTRADFILYYVPEWAAYLKIPTPELRNFLTFAPKYPIKHAKNHGYTSSGFLVPWATLAEMFETIQIK